MAVKKTTAKKSKKEAKSEYKAIFPDYVYMGISEEAVLIFDAIAKKYSEKIDVELDFATLAIFAESSVRLQKYFKLTNGKSPMASNGKNMLHPILNAISMQEKQIHITASKLGLTPDARNKIKLDLAEIEKRKVGRKPKNPVDDYIL